MLLFNAFSKACCNGFVDLFFLGHKCLKKLSSVSDPFRTVLLILSHSTITKSEMKYLVKLLNLHVNLFSSPAEIFQVAIYNSLALGEVFC